jgi:hypothetical protein
MNEQEPSPPQFPSYTPVPHHTFMQRKQTSPLFKLANKMLKMPKTKVLQRRNRVTKRKFKII